MLKKFPVLLLLSLHLSFLAVAFLENIENITISLILVAITVLVGISYRQHFKNEKGRLKSTDLLLTFSAGIGAIITYWLNLEFHTGIVLAAGITGLGSSFLPFINRRSVILRELPAAIYCGAFAGMTAPFIAKGYFFIILAGLFSGIILILSKSTLQGFGGKLGSIAFGGVAFVSLILYIFS